MQTPHLFDIAIAPHTFASLNKEVLSSATLAKSRRAGLEILNVNAHAINLCFSDAKFYHILKTCHQVFCDGEGVRMVLRQRGYSIPHRITYADWLPLLLMELAQANLKLFVYGGRPSVHSESLQIMRNSWPGILVSGCHGYEEEELVIARINEFEPHVVLVCLGMPKQEHFIRRHRDIGGGAVWLSGGAALDYFSRSSVRAPKFMRNFGLEWFFRLCMEPRRLFLRYVMGNPLFLWRAYRNIRPS